ncbi:MAG: class I SAM-dependent methyltransferase [Candidatus Hydrogenedentota bacterium]|nr:MAG: class I SAM-dependent methyltransferase [Candidatus Hydrogenedentota bacterium]
MKRNRDAWEENIYRKGRHLNRLPYTHVLQFLHQSFESFDLSRRRVLEVGCGAGNNLFAIRWLFNAEVYGIDFSEEAVRVAKNRFQEKGYEGFVLSIADACSLPFRNEFFDAVIDRSALQHNLRDDIRRAVLEIFRVLRNNGVFYSMVTTTGDPAFGRGRKIGERTFFDDSEGVGTRYFFSEDDVSSLFQPFEITEWLFTEEFNVLSRQKRGSYYHLIMKKKGRPTKLRK